MSNNKERFRHSSDTRLQAAIPPPRQSRCFVLELGNRAPFSMEYSHDSLQLFHHQQHGTDFSYLETHETIAGQRTERAMLGLEEKRGVITILGFLSRVHEACQSEPAAGIASSSHFACCQEWESEKERRRDSSRNFKANKSMDRGVLISSRVAEV